MGKVTRKRYSADFKAKVAIEAIRGELTIAQLTAKFGVHQTLINTWKKQASEGLSTVFETIKKVIRGSLLITAQKGTGCPRTPQ